MTVRTIRASVEESDRILEGKVRYIFRGANEFFRVGDVIEFAAYKDTKRVLHKNNEKKYIVTTVSNYLQAPVIKGFQVIGFRSA